MTITLTREEAQQPEALRLADWHKAMADEPKRNESKRDKHRRTEAELRRLHEVNAELVEELRNIANATPSKWDAEVRDQFQQWAQNRARAAIAKATGEQQ